MKIDISRIIKIDFLINQRRTGTPDALAKYLNISRRSLFENLSYMKNSLKAPITYNKGKKTYMYSEEGVFCFTYQKDKNGMIKKAITEATKLASILWLLRILMFLNL